MKNKVEHWRSQPEHIRVRLATRLTWMAGAVMIVLWLAVLLPFQLHIARDDEPQPAIQGAHTTDVPTPTPSPSPPLFNY